MNYQSEYCKLKHNTYCQHPKKAAVCHGHIHTPCRWNCSGGTCTADAHGTTAVPWSIVNGECKQDPHLANNEFEGWGDDEECKDNIARYNCGPKGCVESVHGTFSTMEECQQSCRHIGNLDFTCDPSKGCIPDQNGQYSSMQQCHQNCVNGHVCDKEYGWKSEWVNPNHNISKSDCKFNYTCEQGSCIANGFSTTPVTKDACEQTCGYGYNCNQYGHCVQAKGGKYSSQDQCAAKCYGKLVKNYTPSGDTCNSVNVYNEVGGNNIYSVPYTLQHGQCVVNHDAQNHVQLTSTAANPLHCFLENDSGLTYCCENKVCDDGDSYYKIDYGKSTMSEVEHGHTSNVYYYQVNGMCKKYTNIQPQLGKTYSSLSSCQSALPCFLPTATEKGQGCKLQTKVDGKCPSGTFTTLKDCQNTFCWEEVNNTCRPAVCIDHKVDNKKYFPTVTKCDTVLCNPGSVNGKGYRSYFYKEVDSGTVYCSLLSKKGTGGFCGYLNHDSKGVLYVNDMNGHKVGDFYTMYPGSSVTSSTFTAAMVAVGMVGGSAAITGALAAGIATDVIPEALLGVIVDETVTITGIVLLGALTSVFLIAVVILAIAGIVALVEYGEEDDFYPVNIPGLGNTKPLYVRSSTHTNLQNLGKIHFKYPRDVYQSLTFGDSTKSKLHKSDQLNLWFLQDGSVCVSDSQVTAILNMFGADICVGSDGVPYHQFIRCGGTHLCDGACHKYHSMGSCPPPVNTEYTQFCSDTNVKSVEANTPIGRARHNVCDGDKNCDDFGSKNVCTKSVMTDMYNQSDSLYRMYGPILDLSC